MSFVSHGKKLVALMRMSCLPFELSNYVLGMTRVTFRDYFIGSLALLPNLVVLVIVGANVTDIGSILKGTYHGSTLSKVLAIMSVVVAIVLMGIIIVFARNELRRITEEEERAAMENEESNLLMLPDSTNGN